MLITRISATLVLGAVIASSFAACSAGTDGNTFGNNNLNNGASGGSGNPNGGAGPAGGVAYGAGGEGTFNVGGAPPATGTDSGIGDGTCGVVQKPEEVFQYSPVALYIMQDISSSMVGTLGDPTSWPNSLAAVTAFVQDPSSAGLDVGLAVFPAGGSACDGSDCGKPVVEIGPLPANAQPLVSGMQASVPPICCNLTPTECALRGMINHCKDWTAKTGEKCVAVLVTDGEPTVCDLNATNLAGVVAQGKTDGVTTFTIGLPGSNKQFLDDLAAKGGSGASVDVSGGSAAFIAALNAIRTKVAIGTKLECQWKIPPPKDGQVFDPAKVNVTFTPKGGMAQDFGYVAQADCARASNAWYFDDPNKPTQVLVCPTTCDTLKAASGAEVNVAFGCARKPAILR